MKILIAEDDMLFRTVLTRLLTNWNYEVVSTANGKDALNILTATTPPQIAILDVLMPEMTGLEVCKEVRKKESQNPTYLILLTAMDSKKDIIEGFDAGADDYIIKPFDNDELRVRVRVGQRVMELQNKLHEHISSLQDALAHIKTLQGILPVCSNCLKIRNDQESWERIENYISKHSEARFSHTLCPECMQKLYPDYYEQIQKKFCNKHCEHGEQPEAKQ